MNKSSNQSYESSTRKVHNYKSSLNGNKAIHAPRESLPSVLVLIHEINAVDRYVGHDVTTA